MASYYHIDNLYKDPGILEVYALEKIHGSSASIEYQKGIFKFSPGGQSLERFRSLFNEQILSGVLASKFPEEKIAIYGEVFGGSLHKMSATYGEKLRFMVFDIQLEDTWLNVLSASILTRELGLEFVPFERGPLTLEWLDQQRDRDSVAAVAPGKPREGIVIRPINEMYQKGGRRFIYKHKRPEFAETKTPREVDPNRGIILSEAAAVADEWVTPMRLEHVLQKTPYCNPKDTGAVIRAMLEDVRREGEGEIEWSKPVEGAISKATANLLRQHCQVEG